MKTQDPGVLVRAKSYKSQRKNEEPWRLQVFIVHSYFVIADANALMICLNLLYGFFSLFFNLLLFIDLLRNEKGKCD